MYYMYVHFFVQINFYDLIDFCQLQDYKKYTLSLFLKILRGKNQNICTTRYFFQEKREHLQFLW